MAEQLEITFPDDRWDYHRGLPDRAGPAAYTHLLRWHGDPPETLARGAQARAEGVRAVGASKRAGGSVAGSMDAIRAHLADGIPRTFNCIAIQLTGYTADALVGSPIEAALWALCEDGALAWACEEEAVFWTLASMVEWNDEGRAAA